MWLVERIDPLRQEGRKGEVGHERTRKHGTRAASLRLLSERGYPGILDSLSEDVQWVTAEIEGVPVGGTWQGREQVGQFFQTLSEAQEPQQFEPREFVAQDDRVVALGHYAWHVKSTSKVWESDFAHVFTVHIQVEVGVPESRVRFSERLHAQRRF
jgi:ketosteroid isomerase-like protein